MNTFYKIVNSRYKHLDNANKVERDLKIRKGKYYITLAIKCLFFETEQVSEPTVTNTLNRLNKIHNEEIPEEARKFCRVILRTYLTENDRKVATQSFKSITALKTALDKQGKNWEEEEFENGE